MYKNLKGIQKANEEFNHVINLLMKSKVFGNEEKAFAVLKACLKALRDRIGKGEAVQLGSQLSPILRGFYYEGWRITEGITRAKTPLDFMEEVRGHFLGHDEVDLERAVPVTLGVILELIDEGEALQVMRNLPQDIQDFFLS